MVVGVSYLFPVNLTPRNFLKSCLGNPPCPYHLIVGIPLILIQVCTYLPSSAAYNSSSNQACLEPTGVVCSVVGTLVESGKLPHVDIVKMAPSLNPIQNEMWPLEVKELRNFLTNRVVPRLEIN